jgi:hypothetical protein
VSDLEALRAELADLRATVEELRRATTPPPADTPVTRRGAFKALGAAAVGAAAGSLALAAPAGALDGQGVTIGNDAQTAESPTVLRVTNGTGWVNASVFGGLGLSDVATANLPSPGEGVAENAAVFGLTDASAFSYGVAGVSIAPEATGGAFYAPLTGLLGVSTDPTAGVGAYFAGAEGNVQLDIGALDPGAATGETGLVRAADDVLWYCVSAEGSDRWRRLTAGNSAGAFTAITPVRVYDSRWSGVAGVTTGVINPGATREISVADGRDAFGTVDAANAVPAGARAIAYNITVTNTVGGGFLNVTPGGTSSSSSTINWFASGVDLANSAIVGLSTTRRIRVAAGGTGPTNFIVDVAGYWL